MYKEYIIPNNEKGRKLLQRIKELNKTVIITRNSYHFKVKVKEK